MIIPTMRRKIAAKSRSVNLASSAFSPLDAIDKVLQAVSTMRLPEPKGTIFDTVDTCSPFFPCCAAGFSRTGPSWQRSPCLAHRPYLISRPVFGCKPTPPKEIGWLRAVWQFILLMRMKIYAPLLPHRLQIIAYL
jgi:hypothetical protein